MRGFMLFRLCVFITAMPAVTGGVRAQDFPSKTIRIVATAPGGFSDVSSRLIAQALSASFGRPVIVENRGGTTVAIETVVKASPDGYSLLLYGSGIWLLPFMRDKLSYDPIRDLAPVTLTTRSPNIVVVHPSVPANSVAELIALAKARPGQLNYGSGTPGSTPHLAGELFKSMAGVDIVRINYTGAAPALNGLMSAQVQLMFAAAAALPHVKAGRLRGLAVTSAEPSALVPGLPTVAASGVPGYESVAIFGVFAPARTPEAVIKRLNQEIVLNLNHPDMKQKFFNAGAEVTASTPAQLMATVKSEMARMGKVIRDAGIRDE